MARGPPFDCCLRQRSGRRTDADAAFALGYAHAEDDFPTIEEVMASSRGRLGEITGRDGAAIDYVHHLLGVRGDVEERYESDLSAETRAVVEAYADGLNLYAARHPEELRLAGLFPVTGQDIAAYTTMTLPFFFGLDRTITALVEGEDPPRDGADPNERGSNAFAVAPSRSPDGETQLILNSHQPWSGPVAWYEAHATSLEGLDMLGGLFPGAPLPLTGHNRHLGWANTVNRPDLVDVYELTLSEDGDSYRFDNQWRPLEKRRVWLNVRIGPLVVPVPQTIHRSVHGPVIVNERGAFAIRYAGIGDVRAMEQYYRLTRATNFEEWRAAMAMQAIPATNFIYADAEGHIGLFYNARFPSRGAGHDWRGVLRGDTSETLWSDYAPFEAFPRLVDPASGFIVNSNNSPCFASAAADNLDCGDYSPLLGVEFFETNRAIRAIELLTALDAITPEALLQIKYDTGVARGSIMGRYFESLLALDAGDPPTGRAQALLARWDWN
ncbi:MAG: penicillin acylase family protein, partial [Sphingomonadales bacterium]|nr:penicillin acylase family protein [Sphingomonadales bacterium]